MKQHVLVQNLSVNFGDFKAVDDVSFSVAKCEIFGFLGANGAGKTTTIRVLCGLLQPSSGHVRVAGHEIHSSLAEASELAEQLNPVKNAVGYMSQRFTLYQDLSVGENLDFAASLRKLDTKYYQSRRKELLDFVGFDRDPETLVSELPGGIRQQVSLVTSILHDPEVVFLDEPTAGVTPLARSRFWNLIRRLSEQGKTVFVTTHYMDEAEQCGRIALMRTGQLIALDSPADLKTKVFKGQIVELTPKKPDRDKVLQQNLERSFLSVQPHGRKLHVTIESEEQWKNWLSTGENKSLLQGSYEQKNILPSLEDVFIQLVEPKGGRTAGSIKKGAT